MDSEFIMAAFWFVFGALSFQLASYLLNLGRSILMVQQTVFGLLLMLKYYDKVFQGEKEKIINQEKEKKLKMFSNMHFSNLERSIQIKFL